MANQVVMFGFLALLGGGGRLRPNERSLALPRPLHHRELHAPRGPKRKKKPALVRSRAPLAKSIGTAERTNDPTEEYPP